MDASAPSKPPDDCSSSPPHPNERLHARISEMRCYWNPNPQKLWEVINDYHFMANRWRNNGNSVGLHFLGFQNHWRWWQQPWNKRCLLLGCESWTIKKAEHQRIDAFELWYFRRFLRVPWAARRSNQSILEEISPKCSLEGLMLKLKLQYFGHLMQKLTHWKDPEAGKDWRQEEKGMAENAIVRWHHQFNGHEFE